MPLCNSEGSTSEPCSAQSGGFSRFSCANCPSLGWRYNSGATLAAATPRATRIASGRRTTFCAIRVPVAVLPPDNSQSVAPASRRHRDAGRGRRYGCEPGTDISPAWARCPWHVCGTGVPPVFPAWAELALSLPKGCPWHAAGNHAALRAPLLNQEGSLGGAIQNSRFKMAPSGPPETGEGGERRTIQN